MTSGLLDSMGYVPRQGWDGWVKVGLRSGGSKVTANSGVVAAGMRDGGMQVGWCYDVAVCACRGYTRWLGTGRERVRFGKWQGRLVEGRRVIVLTRPDP